MSRELVAIVADRLRLGKADRASRLSSGETVLANRIGWALTYMAKAGAVERPVRGQVRITKRGRALLKQRGDIRVSILDQFPEFKKWRTQASRPRQTTLFEDASPQETIELAMQSNNQLVQENLQERLRKVDPSFFERIALDLLTAMGYTGAKGRALALGGPGDGGIDGALHRDPLGLDTVYIQAKRYTDSVGPDRVNSFFGALERSKASKGVLITSGTFTKEAHKASKEGSKTVILVDGDRMAALMLEHGVGVSDIETYRLRRVDSDYFDPE